MVIRVLLISVLLLGLAGLGGVAYVSLLPPPAQRAEAPAPPPRATYLLAARPLRPGSLVKPEDLRPQEMLVSEAPAGARLDSASARAELIGAMVRRTLPAGDPMLGEDVLRPGERGFLAAVLGPNMRAVSVGVDLVSGSAGLIWPGDRVDLLLTQQLNDENLPLYRRIAGETVLSDVRVIAIDQALVQGAVGDGPETNRQVRTVTLEVSSRQAERVAVATRLGRLSLLVRSADEPATVPPLAEPATPPITWGGDVSSALRGGRTDNGGTTVIQVFQGSGRRDEFRF